MDLDPLFAPKIFVHQITKKGSTKKSDSALSRTDGVRLYFTREIVLSDENFHKHFPAKSFPCVLSKFLRSSFNSQIQLGESMQLFDM